MRAVFLAAVVVVAIGCSEDSSSEPCSQQDAGMSDAAVGRVDAEPGACPNEGVRGSGQHRLFTQGTGGTPDSRGIWPLLHEWHEDGSDAELCDEKIFTSPANCDGIWQPDEIPLSKGPDALKHGEHFLVGVGAYVEFSATLCEDITGDVTFYIPNYDEAGSRALHQLFVVHEGEEFLIAEVTDEEAGQSGYNPFVRIVAGNDPIAVMGDELRLRSTNLNGVAFSVMVWQPPSEYESWVSVTVP